MNKHAFQWMMRYSIITVLLILHCSLIYAETDNFALHKRITGSFQDMPKLTDGIITPENIAYTEDIDSQPKSFIIILGQPKYLDVLNLYWIKGQTATEYRVEVSDDFINWQIIADKINGTTGHYKNGFFVKDTSLNGHTALFIKITVFRSENQKAALSEIEIFTTHQIDYSFSQFTLENIGEYTADIIIETTQPTEVRLRIGQTVTAMQDIALDLNYKTRHRFTIPELLRGTDYYVQTVARDVNGTTKASSVHRFRTLGIPLPLISNLHSITVEKTAVTIGWDSNVKTKSIVKYGLTADLTEEFIIDTYKTSHAVRIENITPNTTLYYTVIGIDENSNPTDNAIPIKQVRTLENNVALNATVADGTFLYDAEQYSEDRSEKYLKRLVDGDLTFFTGTARSEIIAQRTQYLLLDLGKQYPLETVRIYWRALAYSRNYTIEISPDKKQWITVQSDIDAANGKLMYSQGAQGGDPLQVMETAFSPIEARWVKIAIPQNSPIGTFNPIFGKYNKLQLAEVVVIPEWRQHIGDLKIKTID